MFDPFDVKDMAEKIFTIWTNKSLRGELILKGHENTKNLTMENYAQKWESLIEKAVKSSPDLRT
jgi:glycosyltransferase involved in cell wall biosynthesis